MEHPIPPEFKWAKRRISLGEIFQIDTEPVEESEYKWINKIFKKESSYLANVNYFKSEGFTEKESKYLVEQSLSHTLRSADWAHVNEAESGQAANCILTSGCFGVIKILLNAADIFPAFLSKIPAFLENIYAAFRGLLQFQIYGERCDDDRAENLYEAQYYGNKAAGFFADEAYRFETKINPVVLPLLPIFGERIENLVKPLLSFFNILWWRIRMPAEIEQRLGTDVLNFLIHKPLSLLGIKSSTEKIEDINEFGNLKGEYIRKRTRSLIGLDENKDKSISVFKKFCSEFKNLLTNENKDEKIKSTIKINKFIAPFLGLYGFFTALVGIPLTSAFKFFGKESRLLNSFTQSCFASQQIIYFFRMMLPDFFENKKISKIDSKNNEELTIFKKKRQNLFAIGATVCGLNIGSVFLKLFNPNENKFLKTLTDLIYEISDKGIPYFLSKRRSILGTKFRIDNPELFNVDGMPKVKFDENMLLASPAECFG